MNAMQILALSEGHKKCLPGMIDRPGSGNPSAIAKSIEAKRAILDVLSNGMDTRGGISKKSGIPKHTIYSNLKRLRDAGHIEPAGLSGQSILWVLCKKTTKGKEQ